MAEEPRDWREMLPSPDAATPLVLACLRDMRYKPSVYWVSTDGSGKRMMAPSATILFPDYPGIDELYKGPACNDIFAVHSAMNNAGVYAYLAGEADANEAQEALRESGEAAARLHEEIERETARLDAERGPYDVAHGERYTPAQGSLVLALHEASLEAEQAYNRALVAWYSGVTGVNPLTPSLTKTRRRRRTGPIPQPTFHEARNPIRAIQDGRTGRHWTDETQQTVTGAAPALRWKVSGDPIQVLLSPGEHLDWLAIPSTHDTLRAELRAAGTPATLLLAVCIRLAIEDGRAEVSLDDLVEAIGKTRRHAAYRQEWREKIWRWLNLFKELRVYGCRQGTWKDPRTKKVIPMETDDPLIRVDGRRWRPIQPDLDGNEPPLKVTIEAGEWLDPLRGNPEVLTFFGDLRKLAAIPSGKPSGEWAQAIGLFLNQWWREQATHSPIGHTGEGNRAVVKYKPLTRRHILDKAGLLAEVEALLSSTDPGRAKEYWDGAIRDLCSNKHRVIGFYKETAPLDAGRKGWQKAWLNQSMTIRPTAEDAAAAAQVNRAATVAKAKRGKRGKEDKPPAG